MVFHGQGQDSLGIEIPILSDYGKLLGNEISFPSYFCNYVPESVQHQEILTERAPPNCLALVSFVLLFRSHQLSLSCNVATGVSCGWLLAFV